MAKSKKTKNKKKEKQENSKKQELLQEHTSSINNNVKNDNNKRNPVLFKVLKWVIVAILLPIIPVVADNIIPILMKNFPPISPSLGASKSSISATAINYYVKILEDTNYYLAFPTGETGCISINLTNNDESTLVVNNIYLDVFDYQPIANITFLDGIWGDSYSEPVYYGVQLENSCKEYRCTLLDKEGAEYFLSHCSLPDETNFKIMGEQIEYNNTDEIEIILLPLYSGIYRFKIVIDYSIRSFSDRIESDEFEFISLDPNFISQN